MTDERQVRHYVRVIGSSVGWPRREAAMGLGSLWPRLANRAGGAARWVEPVRHALVTALEDDHPMVRWAAVRGLERVGGKAVLRPLCAALGDPVSEGSPRWRAPGCPPPRPPGRRRGPGCAGC